MPPLQSPRAYDHTSHLSVLARMGELALLERVAHAARQDAQSTLVAAASDVRFTEARTRSHPANANLGPISALIAAHRIAKLAHSDAVEKMTRADRVCAAVEGERGERLRRLAVLQKESA
jgi:hypothetical protein